VFLIGTPALSRRLGPLRRPIAAHGERTGSLSPRTSAPRASGKSRCGSTGAPPGQRSGQPTSVSEPARLEKMLKTLVFLFVSGVGSNYGLWISQLNFPASTVYSG
jgi:hypothetical protein